jgi:sugar phosphate isomerase/epimerase
MIKISAFPKCWVEAITNGTMDLFEWIAISMQLECDGLELYFGFLHSTDEAYIDTVRNAVESAGMNISMMCYSPDFTKPSKQEREKEIEKQKEAIRVTSMLGAHYCRVLSGQRRPEVDCDRGVAWVVECISECMKYAVEQNVELVIENHFKDSFWHYPEFAQKSDIFLKILALLPGLGVQYDPSNAIVAGEDPIWLLDQVLPRVRTMHASDRYFVAGATLDDLKPMEGNTGYGEFLRHGVTGKGLNDYDAIFSRLKLVGFDGWISIEDGLNGMGEMKESVDFLKHMRSKWFEG